MRKTALAAIALGASLAFCSPALAAQFVKSPSAVQPRENVLLDTDLTQGDNTVRGTTNKTRSTVVFQSSTDTLISRPKGQAEITATDDSLGTLIFSLADLGTFTSAEFNIIASTAGGVTLEAFSGGTINAAGMLTGGTLLNAGSTQFSLSANGQNFFGFTSADPVSSIRITANGAVISSIGQFRLEGVQGAVPEPATWAMMLVGFGGIGYSMRRRRHATRHVAQAV